MQRKHRGLHLYSVLYFNLIMKIFRSLACLSLVSLLIVAFSCEKWEILYDCEVNEVPGALFPDSPKGNLVYTDEGKFILGNRFALGTNPLDMSRTKVLDGALGPRWGVSPDKNTVNSDWYAISFEFEGIDYSIQEGKLLFPSKSFPVSVSLHHHGKSDEETHEMQGRMKIDGSMDIDGNNRAALAQYKKSPCDVQLFIRLENGQRLRFRFNTLEDSAFSVDYR